MIVGGVSAKQCRMFGLLALGMSVATTYPARAGDDAKKSPPRTPTPAAVEPAVGQPVRRQPPPAPAAEPKPAVARKPAKAATPDSSAAVIDDLIAADAKTIEQNRIDAKALFERAKALETAGKNSEALRLARQARTLDPQLADAAPVIARLQKEIAQRQQANTPIIRARARVAAALARADLLHAERRYASAEDLLKGVVEACGLFRDAASVEQYRTRATEHLARLGAVHTPQPVAIRGETAKDTNQQDAFRLGYGMPAPENFRRLYTAHSFEMPRWYRVQKAALAKTLNVDYRHASAALVFDDIADRAGVQLLIDVPVAQARTHVNATIDLRATDLPAETILNIACGKAGLEYVFVEKAVVITSPEKALEYARNLPEIVRNHWAAARMLFPDIDAALLATSGGTFAPVDAGPELSDAATTPLFLRSGKALVDHIRTLLK